MPPENEITFAEQLQASVVKFLYDINQHDAASAVLSSEITVEQIKDRLEVKMYTSGAFYSQYMAGIEWGEFGERYTVPDSVASIVEQAFRAFYEGWVSLEVYGKLLEIDDLDWKGALQRLLTGDTATNQGLSSEKSPYHKYWQGMHFGSASELEIAKELDRKGVMYFPGSLARVGNPKSRSNKEPDFLVCHKGKWGIIEVDGKPFHPPERTAQEHERGRQFKHHGVKVVEHYDATFCRDHAETVVSEFLKILEQS